MYLHVRVDDQYHERNCIKHGSQIVILVQYSSCDNTTPLGGLRPETGLRLTGLRKTARCMPTIRSVLSAPDMSSAVRLTC